MLPFFFEDRVNGMSHFDAIRNGLMPKFNYRLSVPEMDIKDARKENPNNNVKVDYCDCENIMNSIIASYPRNKWLCFFSTVESINIHKDMISRIFHGYDIYVLHADLNNLRKVIKGFNKSKKAVILSCNMLLEGVHLSGVDAIALFRNVTSLITFQQMLGRICRMGSTVEPVIVDNSQSGPELLSKLLIENGYGGTHKNKTPGDRKEIMNVGLRDHEEWEGIEDFLKRLNRRRFSYEELRVMAVNVFDKYIGFQGSDAYSSFDDMKTNIRDYKKFKACSELYSISPEKAYFILQEEGLFTK